MNDRVEDETTFEALSKVIELNRIAINHLAGPREYSANTRLVVTSNRFYLKSIDNGPQQIEDGGNVTI